MQVPLKKLIALALLLSPSPGFAATDWPFFLNDAGRTAASGALLRQPLELKWSSQHAVADLVNYSSPVVLQDRVFIGNAAGEVKAFDLSPRPAYIAANAGLNKELWSFKASAPIYASPAYALVGSTQTLFAGTVDGNLFALRANTLSTSGQQLWRRAVGGAVMASPLVANLPVLGDVVFCAANDGSVRAFKADTGAPVWRADIGGFIYASPVYDAAQGLVYAVGYEGELVALDAATGAVKWQLTVGPTRATPALFGGVLYTVNRAGLLRAVDPVLAAPTRVLSSLSLPGEASGSPAVAATPGGAGARVVLILQNGRILAVDFAPGGVTPNIAWSNPPAFVNPSGIFANASVAISQELVFVGRENGQVFCVNYATGTIQQPIINTVNSVQISPAVGQNSLLLGHSGGNVLAYGMPTVSFLWTGPSTIVANVPTVYTLTAMDVNGNVVPSYAADVSAGLQGTNPPSVSFDFGQTSVVITATNLGPATLKASVPGGLSGTLEINVVNVPPTPTPTPTSQVQMQVQAMGTGGPGDTVSFQIVAKNAVGAAAATSVSIFNPLPSFTTFLSATTDPGVPMTLNTPSVGGTGNVSWSIPSLGGGQSVTLSLTVEIDPSLTSACGYFSEDFEDYGVGAQITADHPERWSSSAPSYYTAESTGFGQTLQMKSILSLLPPLGSRTSFYSQYFLNSVPNFSGETSMELEFFAPSTNMQDIIRLGDFSVSIDGGNLLLQTDVWPSSIDFSFNTFGSAAPGTWTLGGKMRLQLVYDGNRKLTKASIFDVTLNQVVVQGMTQSGSALPTYQIQLWNQAANLAPSGYLHVDNISLGRSVIDAATLSCATQAPRTAWDGFAMTCSFSPLASASLVAPALTGTPAAGASMAIVAGGGGVSAGSHVLVDSYDSRLSPYNAATAGSEGNVLALESIEIKGSTLVRGKLYPETASQLNVVAPPAALVSLGNLVVEANTTLVLPAGDYYYDSIEIRGGATLQVQGKARLWFGQTLNIQGDAGPLSQLPAELSFFGDAGATEVSVLGSPVVYGLIYAPSADIHVSGHSVVYGALAGATVDLSGNAELHYDLALENTDYQPLPPANPGNMSSSVLRPGPKGAAVLAWLPKDKDLAVAPNPSAREVLVGFRLAKAGRVRILVSDLAGALVQVTDLGSRPAGEQSVEASVAGLASGIYIAVLEVDEGMGKTVKAYFKMAVVR